MTAKEQLRQQWATRVAEFRASGMTLKAWCAAHNCTVDQMKYPASAPSATRFIPITSSRLTAVNRITSRRISPIMLV
ncbi:hypothetical protein O9H85_32805 [Paenibacillus filicis]|uniref:Uncharacterized protein n=1 Tax=Paenibacillus gyeongsangnamensis TaxID=3388067 RepID=A0ABT4QJK2_9BACL|nr:hypothetical protein [Paenibacillus filicis]MCZ8517052.1 hypothetical protein [Paenibacillus filicis]